MLNFDATDPKDFRGTPKVNLVLAVWRPAPLKVRISQKLLNILGILASFLRKLKSLAKRSTFVYRRSYSEGLCFSGQFGQFGKQC